MSDVRLAIRHLAKSPGFTVAAVLSIALGIGANTAIFTLVDELLLRSLPVRHPEELVLFRAIHGSRGRMSRMGEGPGRVDPGTGRASSSPFSLLIFERLRTQRGAALSDLFAYAPFSQANVLVGGQPEPSITAQFVSGTYHGGLGVRAAIGRTITAEDDSAVAAPVAVISFRYWETRFASDPGVLGRTIALNRVPVPIVGVTARGFAGALQAGESADVSVPLAHHQRFQPERKNRVEPWYWWLRIMGRLAPGATAAQARASLEPIFQEAAREGWLAGQASGVGSASMPDDPLLAADPGAQGEDDRRRQFSGTLRILMALVSLVLIAACANVANLLLARGASRRREIAVRLALGAGRGRIVRQLMVESLLLALAGAAIGTSLAWWGRGLLMAVRPFGNIPVVLGLPLDGRVLAFTSAVAAATALAFGLVPALRATRADVIADFQGGTRTMATGRSRVSQALMVVQIALSLVLLVSAGLFVRTIANLKQIDAGFDVNGLVFFRIDATSAGYTPGRAAVLHARMRDDLASIPGVRAVTFSRVPLLSRTRQNMTFSLPGRAMPPGAPTNVNVNGLAVGFFGALRLPLLGGREFTAADREGSPKVAIVNHAFARTYFADLNPIGETIQFSAPGNSNRVEIVGVAGDAKYTELRGEYPPTIYLPALQQPDGAAAFAVRASGDPGSIFPAIRAAVQTIDPALPVIDLRTQSEQIDRLNGQELLFARLSGFFGIAALGVACVGLYGLTSHGVVRRTSEIGLRMALGARSGNVLRMILGESLVLVGAGILIGSAAAYAATRLVSAMLFGVSRMDPATYVAAAAVLATMAVAAAVVPARRAARLDPLRALRVE